MTFDLEQLRARLQSEPPPSFDHLDADALWRQIGGSATNSEWQRVL
jgi:hypothetical protein